MHPAPQPSAPRPDRAWLIATALGLGSGLMGLLAFGRVAGVVVGLLVLLGARLVQRRRRGAQRAPRRRLRFTRDGVVLVLITLGVGVGAINTGNNLLYLMLGMLLSLIIVSGVLSEQTLRGLEVIRTLPPTVHAGRGFLADITLVNRKRRVPSYSVQVEDLVAGEALTKRCYFLKIPAGARQATSYRGAFERRGLYRFQAVRISTRFPFAFFVKQRTAQVPGELLVLPRIHPVAELPMAARGLIGDTVRPRRGLGREFHGLRRWREGDDARDIHWRRTARAGQIILKEYALDGAHRIGVMLSLYRADLAPDDPQLDRLVDLVASLMVHLGRPAPGRPGRDLTLRLGHEAPRSITTDGRGRAAALRSLAFAAFSPGTPPAAPSLAPDLQWVLVCVPGTAHALEPGRFAHVFEGA